MEEVGSGNRRPASIDTDHDAAETGVDRHGNQLFLGRYRMRRRGRGSLANG